MKRVVIDANVIVSAIISPHGSPAKILRLLQDGKIQILVSYPVLHEIITALMYPHLQKRHGLSQKQVSEKIFHLGKIGKLVNPCKRLEVITDDPADNKYLELAVEGEADYIVSGDKHLKKLKSFRGIEIVEPGAFLKMME
jgi:hypothetical protein